MFRKQLKDMFYVLYDWGENGLCPRVSDNARVTMPVLACMICDDNPMLPTGARGHMCVWVPAPPPCVCM